MYTLKGSIKKNIHDILTQYLMYADFYNNNKNNNNNSNYWRKRTTIFKDMFRHAYAIFSLIVNNKNVIQLYNTKYE